MSEAAWNKVFTHGSTELKNRLMKVHAKNPKFQSWLQSSGHGAGQSVAKASKEIKPSQRVKTMQAKSIQAYGATKGTKMGGEHGSSDEVRDTIAPLTRDQHSKVQAAARAAKKTPLTQGQRMAAIAAAVRKAQAKHDVATLDNNDEHDDLADVHQSLHITRGYNEEVEQIDEAKRAINITTKDLDIVKSGDHETVKNHMVKLITRAADTRTNARPLRADKAKEFLDKIHGSTNVGQLQKMAYNMYLGGDDEGKSKYGSLHVYKPANKAGRSYQRRYGIGEELEQVNEAKKGPLHVVHASYTHVAASDPVGPHRATINYKVHAPDKEAAKRYAERDLKSKYRSNLKIHSARLVKENEELEQMDEESSGDLQKAHTLAAKFGHTHYNDIVDLLVRRGFSQDTALKVANSRAADPASYAAKSGTNEELEQIDESGRKLVSQHGRSDDNYTAKVWRSLGHKVFPYQVHYYRVGRPQPEETQTWHQSAAEAKSAAEKGLEKLNAGGSRSRVVAEELEQVDEAKNKPYVRPFRSASGDAGWKAMNKHGKTQYFNNKAAAEKHAGEGFREMKNEEVSKAEAEKVLGGPVKEKPTNPPKGKLPLGFRRARNLARQAMKAGKSVTESTTEVSEVNEMSYGKTLGKVILEKYINEKADSREYDYEGDMAKSQLKSIIMNAQRLHDSLEDTTNLPEWVQLKITLAEDYVVTAANYMEGEMNEEALAELAASLDEEIELFEKAPPGSKYERMVKHIKKGYSAGGLTPKEKSIAYATAWKAYNKANEEVEVSEEAPIYNVKDNSGKVIGTHQHGPGFKPSRPGYKPGPDVSHIPGARVDHKSGPIGVNRKIKMEEVEQVEEGAPVGTRRSSFVSRDSSLASRARKTGSPTRLPNPDSLARRPSGYNTKNAIKFRLGMDQKGDPSYYDYKPNLPEELEQVDEEKSKEYSGSPAEIKAKYYHDLAQENKAKKENNAKEKLTKEAAEGTVAVTPKEKALAAHHGDKKQITYGDVIKARIKSAAAKAMKAGK